MSGTENADRNFSLRRKYQGLKERVAHCSAIPGILFWRLIGENFRQHNLCLFDGYLVKDFYETLRRTNGSLPPCSSRRDRTALARSRERECP